MQAHSLGRGDPLEGKWQPTPVFLPGEPHGQRKLLLGRSPQGSKSSDTAERWRTVFKKSQQPSSREGPGPHGRQSSDFRAPVMPLWPLHCL